MEALGIDVVDLVVLGIILFGGLIGLITGFLRGGLFVLSWIGAIFVTWHGFPHAQPIAQQYIESDLVADVAAGAALFLVALITLHLISHVLSGWVRNSRMNALDRTLGLVTGLATATAMLGAAYLFVTPDNGAEPPVLQGAKTLPVLQAAASFVERLTPAEVRRRFDATRNSGERSLRRAEESRRALELLASPPPTKSREQQPGYQTGERNQLNRLIEGSQ